MSDDWLPDLIWFADFNGDWNKYLEALHTAFEEDFVNSKPRWLKKPVRLKRHPEYEGKSATFWHMISEGATEDDRTPDFRRCERIRWPRPMMEEHDHLPAEDSKARLIWWEEERRNEKRIVLALTDFSYVMVIADRRDYVLPWTAYHVEREHQRKKLQRKHQAFWDAQKG